MLLICNKGVPLREIAKGTKWLLNILFSRTCGWRHHFWCIRRNCRTWLSHSRKPWNNTHPWWKPSLHFFSNSFTIFLIVFIQHSPALHIWKCMLDPEQNAQHGHQPSSIFSQIFSCFYCYFSFSIATLSTFGSAHWTLITVLKLVTNKEHHLE